MSSILFRSRPTEQRAVLPPELVARINAGMYGSYVDSESAMRHDAVWSCRTRIAQDVSMMPVDVVRYQAGQRVEVSPMPQIIAAPSSRVDALDWRYQVIDAWLGDGNAWGLITSRTATGLPTRIELLAHSEVKVRDDRYYVDGAEEFLWPVGRLWHVPAYTLPGQTLGLSPIAYHRHTIESGLNAGKFGSDFFVAGGVPSSILTVDSQPDEAQAKRLKQKLLEITRGNREPLVLPKGTEYKQISVSPTDSQFIDTQRYTGEQVCRIFGEDPADHGMSAGGTSMTYANRSDADLARYKRRQFWVTKLQVALTALVPRPQVVRLNTSSSLMMTARERHELHGIRLAARTRTVNEIRLLEDEMPFGPEFDVPGIPPLTNAPGGAPSPEGDE